MENRQINVSFVPNRTAGAVKTTPMEITSFYEKFSISPAVPYTSAEFKALSRAAQDEIKDIGGYIAGTSKNGRRRAGDITRRCAALLDLDNIPAGLTDYVLQALAAIGAPMVVHSTVKHTPETPRLRAGAVFAEDIDADLYGPVIRVLCHKIQEQMTWFDPSCIEANRLMFFPCHTSDVDPVYRILNPDAPLLDAKAFLTENCPNWRDLDALPRFPREDAEMQGRIDRKAKQEDPTAKGGLIGAFNRAYDIPAAMDAFLPGIYDPIDTNPNRYTYSKGSTYGGAVVYENGKFLFSHHATDPCSGQLVNSFDLVRLHKFGDLDADAKPNTPNNKLPSFKAMSDFILQDGNTLLQRDADRQNAGPREFAGLAAEDPGAWQLGLARDGCGDPLPTIDNIMKILDNDPLLKGKFALNEFAGRGEILGALPWDGSGKRRLWDDTDSDGLYWYMEKHYKCTKRGNIDSALNVHALQHRFNEVADYLTGLTWDGKPRLDTLFIDYLGAEDNAYTRTVCRKSFTAAVARAMDPGCKYDFMPILCGPQGIGKSTLLDKMSCGWFNDSIRTFEGKEASELLQGVWLVEVAELDAFRRTDVSRIKQFLSLRADRYRAAYGRHVRELPRRAVFFGTCNQMEFLQDTTGNRRFWPVDVGNQHDKTVWRDLTPEVIAQIWAEAVARWRAGETLYLSGDVEKYAQQVQEDHREEDPNERLIQEFSLKPIPVDWAKWDLNRRLDYWAGGIVGEVELTERVTICPLEIWCELFHGRKTDHKPADMKLIRDTLSRMPEWERDKIPFHAGTAYGTLRGYRRKKKSYT